MNYKDYYYAFYNFHSYDPNSVLVQTNTEKNPKKQVKIYTVQAQNIGTAYAFTGAFYRPTYM